MLLKQSTARNRMILMTDVSDHLTGKSGLTLTITASKNGGAFASITPTVTDRGSGWYSLALTAVHTDTLGDLALHVTGQSGSPLTTTADPTDIVDEVVVELPGVLSGVPTAVENADALLGRNVAGGSSTGRTVAQAMFFLRNRRAASGGTMTVYAVDDTTPSWTAALTAAPGADPISDINPA